jgi:excisionase family DNA binding protein
MNTPLIIQPPKNAVELSEIVELVNQISNVDKVVITKTDGQSIEMPNMITPVLYEIINILSKGGAMTIVPMGRELTTQQAADILNVSRPYLVNKLLKTGKIPYTKVGTHRKILMKDLMEYKEEAKKNRDKKMAELVKLSQELGLYD